MQLNGDLREFIELLNSNAVEYLVVGAFAVAWHGAPRFTGDIDFLVRANPANANAILTTLRQFGFASLELTVEDFIRPDQVIQLGFPPSRIDIITSISGVTFDEAWNGRMSGSIDGLPVQFIGIEELIRNKESTGRSKDLGDADAMRKRRPLV